MGKGRSAVRGNPPCPFLKLQAQHVILGALSEISRSICIRAYMGPVSEVSYVPGITEGQPIRAPLIEPMLALPLLRQEQSLSSGHLWALA